MTDRWSDNTNERSTIPNVRSAFPITLVNADAAAGLLAPVSCRPLRDGEVYVHLCTVASESGLPICIYDNQGKTLFSFSMDPLTRLSCVEGIVAAKYPFSSLDEVADCLAGLRSKAAEGLA